MKNKKAEIGWSFIVKLVIGLMLLIGIIIIAANSKEWFTELFIKLGGIFG